jgi:hypothetical protein
MVGHELFPDALAEGSRVGRRYTAVAAWWVFEPEGR